MAPFSAIDMRELIGAAENDPAALKDLEEFIGEGKVLDLLSLLGVEAATLDEMLWLEVWLFCGGV